RLSFFFQAEDGIRDYKVTGVQTCALPICLEEVALQRMIQHLMDVGGSSSSHYLVDGLLRDSFRHGRGCLEDVDGFPKVSLGHFYNRFQTSLSGLQGLVFRDSVEVFDDFLRRERREPEQRAP